MCPAKRRDRGGRPERRTMREFFPDDLVVQFIDRADRGQAIADLLNALVMAGRLDLSREREVRDQIRERESVASTGIGCGVAIPHSKTKHADRLGLAVGISSEGIDFSSHDGQRVKVVMLWICPPSATKEHLGLMRAIASIARDPDQAEGLAKCRDRLSLLNYLDTIDAPEKK